MSQYVHAFLKYVQRLPLELDHHVEELYYKNPVLILADAVLSMNRKYVSFVVPRIRLIESQEIISLNQLDTMINSRGLEGFSDVWNYNHPKRVEILHNLTKKFIALSYEYELGELESMSQWGLKSKPEQWTIFGVSGIGFTTYQYLRMLCGANTVKPDIYIQRAFKNAVGKNSSLAEIVGVVEMAANAMGVRADRLDHALWKYYSQGKAVSSKSELVTELERLTELRDRGAITGDEFQLAKAELLS